MKVLQVLESAYRAAVEEQDDTVVWITHAMTGAGADLDVLLRGDAVNYAVRGQVTAPIRVGSWQQTEPSNHERDVAGLPPKGVAVSAVREDLEAHGIGDNELIEGIEVVSSADLPALLDRYDQVWHW